MNNIVILNTTDCFLGFAIANLLSEIAPDNKDITFDYTNDLNEAGNATIIFTEMVAGEFSLCHNLINRKHDETKVFIFYSQEEQLIKKTLPNCISDATFIHKQDSIESIKNTLKKRLTFRNIEYIFEPISYKLRRCFNCNFKVATHTQLKILRSTAIGLNTTDISKVLSLNYSTVLSHKTNIMDKFNLSNRHELQTFARLLIARG